jgi:hypothetical protein
MFSNSGKMLAWVQKPSEFNLRKMMSQEERKDLLVRQLTAKPHLGVTRLNLEYREAYEIIKK